MRKKLLLAAVMLMAIWSKSFACGFDDGDWYYYKLFSQDLMDDPRYRPFLLTYESKYYTDEVLRNGNIEEWQKYLGLSYEDTEYLVFSSSREDLQNLTKGKLAADKELSFATPEFVKKHKQTLLYLAYTKYLEPYMRIIPDPNCEVYNWWWEDSYEYNAGDLDYNKVKTVLTKSWNAEKDDELKLRYGYQLVRLAHYARRYEEAIQLFDQYVKPLNMRTEMYYYALSQKAGALRGLDETEEANRLFIEVFANSNDLKTVAYSSMTFGADNDINFADFVAGAANDKERNDIYFMMGYSDFNNPINEIEKIVANDPNAIQAKVLMVRAVSMIEQALISPSYSWNPDVNQPLFPTWSEYPAEPRKFFNQAIALSDKQRSNASDKNFWNLASSYLHFLNQDFDQANNYLSFVKSNDKLYMDMVRDLTAYIEICRQPTIDADAERNLFAKYGDMIKGETGTIPTKIFINEVLTNRYARQGETAKSYLVVHHLRYLENNPDEKLLDELQSFLNKKKKTPLEAYLAEKGTSDLGNYNNYIAYFKGVLRLSEGNLKEAKKNFEKQTRLKVSRRIFGNNIRVWYHGDEDVVMRDDYISEFSFIHDNMSEFDVTDALMQLQKIGEKSGDEAAKANYLIGNFFYNVSVTGYYRHYLRFDDDNSYSSEKYDSYGSNIYNNTLQLSDEYLAKAMKSATDNELKAHIVFAQAKNAQQVMESEAYSSWDYNRNVPNAQFNILDQFKGTKYQYEVYSNCLYYSDYHN